MKRRREGQGRFIERIDGTSSSSRRSQPGPNSGLRLWYYDDTDSYIFLPYRSIKQYKIGERLTDAEVVGDREAHRGGSRKKAAQRRDQQQQRKANATREGAARARLPRASQAATGEARERDRDRIREPADRRSEAAPRPSSRRTPAGVSTSSRSSSDGRSNIGASTRTRTEAKFIENFGEVERGPRGLEAAEKELVERSSRLRAKPTTGSADEGRDTGEEDAARRTPRSSCRGLSADSPASSSEGRRSEIARPFSGAPLHLTEPRFATSSPCARHDDRVLVHGPRLAVRRHGQGARRAFSGREAPCSTKPTTCSARRSRTLCFEGPDETSSR